MKNRGIAFAILLFAICDIKAQEENLDQNSSVQNEIVINMNVDLTTLKLPPLNILYENARTTPAIGLLEKQKQLQKKLLSKEKKNWLTFFSARGNYSYGIADNYGTSTNITTPSFFQYVGSEQTSWNVGGSVNIPIESLLDISGKIKRQRIQVEIAELQKQQTYDQLRQQIASLYVQILSNIQTLQRSAEYLALYKGASAIADQEYRNRRTSISAVADTKQKEFEANQGFESLRAAINEQLLTLEIISNTPILTSQKKINQEEK